MKRTLTETSINMKSNKKSRRKSFDKHSKNNDENKKPKLFY